MTMRTMRPLRGAARRLGSERGQSIIEMAMVMPLLVVIVLGVIETGHALLDQHIVTKMTREGSNLISRDATLEQAAVAMRTMSSGPVNFDAGSTMIFSVIKRGATTGTANYNQLVLYQRFQFGALSATSALRTRGGASFGGAPNYEARNSDSNTGLQVTNVPGNLVTVPGGMVYVTELFSTHTLLTPLDRFGVSMPRRLYSIAYF